MRKTAALLIAVAMLLSGCGNILPPLGTQEPSTWETTLPTAAVQPTKETSEPATEAAQPTSEETEAPTETAAPAVNPLSELENTDFVLIADYISTAQVSLAYATEDNFAGVKIYDFTDAYLRCGTLKKLVQASEMLEIYGYGLVIWDAYRPVYAQERLWEACPNAAYVSPPGTGSQTHCRGLAVDVTLYDLETGEWLEMPTGFDDFSSYADRDYRDNSETAAENARLLEAVMKACGFRPYSAEWWHFSDSDNYDIEYEFDPAYLK